MIDYPQRAISKSSAEQRGTVVKHAAWRAYEKLATGKHRTRKPSPRQHERTETRTGADLGSDHRCFPKLSRQAHHRGLLSTSPHLSPRAWIGLGGQGYRTRFRGFSL